MSVPIREKASQLHACSFNCAQSVLAALGSYTNLEEKTALAVSGGFGGGLRCGEICGAASGAVMALGLSFPYSDAADTEAKKKIAALTARFMREFFDTFGCVRCKELKNKGVPCDELIAWAASYAEQLILKEIAEKIGG